MVSRRTTLAGIAAVSTLSTAGCLSSLTDDEEDPGETNASNDTDDEDEANETDDGAEGGEAEEEEEEEHEQVDGAYELTVADLEEGDWVGERVRLEGTVTEAVGGDVVERFALEDDTGTLRMVYPEEARSDYGEGFEVRVEGVVTDGEDVPSTPPVVEEAEVYVQ